MRKNDNFGAKKRLKLPQLAPLAAKVLGLGLFLIYAVVFRLIFELTADLPLTEAAANRYWGMLEYPVAALAILTAATFLIDRVMKNT